MINQFLEQIISLDKKVEKEQAEIKQLARNIEIEAKEKISASEAKELNRLKKEYQQNYEAELEEAKMIRDTSINESKIVCENLQECYEKIRDVTAQEVVKRLLLENINGE